MSLYHYTDKSGVEAIAKSGYIKQSTTAAGDAVFGDGVYLTAISPDKSTYKIIINNWDDGSAIARNPGAIAKTAYCFEIPKSKIPEVRQMSDRSGRDIWLYPDDLTLAGKSVILHERK